MDTFSIANYFILRGIAENKPVTPLKLVKLVFLAHGWFLALTGKALVEEEVEAWPYGPIFRSLYDCFKYSNNEPITSGHVLPQAKFDESLVNFLDRVWEVYRNYSGQELSSITHVDNSPWSQVWTGELGDEKILIKKTPEIIRNDLIKEYYLNFFSHDRTLHRKKPSSRHGKDWRKFTGFFKKGTKKGQSQSSERELRCASCAECV